MFAERKQAKSAQGWLGRLLNLLFTLLGWLILLVFLMALVELHIYTKGSVTVAVLNYLGVPVGVGGISTAMGWIVLLVLCVYWYRPLCRMLRRINDVRTDPDNAIREVEQGFADMTAGIDREWLLTTAICMACIAMIPMASYISWLVVGICVLVFYVCGRIVIANEVPTQGKWYAYDGGPYFAIGGANGVQAASDVPTAPTFDGGMGGGM